MYRVAQKKKKGMGLKGQNKVAPVPINVGIFQIFFIRNKIYLCFISKQKHFLRLVIDPDAWIVDDVRQSDIEIWRNKKTCWTVVINFIDNFFSVSKQPKDN